MGVRLRWHPVNGEPQQLIVEPQREPGARNAFLEYELDFSELEVDSWASDTVQT